MSQSAGERCSQILGAWVDRMQKSRWPIVALAIVLTVGSFGYTIRHIGISTDTVEMISPDVPFREHSIAYRQAFPELNNQIVAVVEAPTPEQSEALAEALSERAQESGDFRDIYRPAAGFLRRHAFLYMSPDELLDLVDNLADAEPLLATLSQDPTMAGLAELLVLAAEHAGGPEVLGDAPGEALGLDGLLGEMAAAAEAQARDAPRDLSWQSLLVVGDEVAQPNRREIVILRPEMDFGRMKPATVAIATLRDAIERVEVGAGLDGAVRLTGDVMITHEELEAVEEGASAAAILSLLLVSLILVFGFRAPRLVLASLCTLLVGLITTAGLATLVVGQLNLISVAFAVLFVGLGIDFCIHFALRYREAHRKGVEGAIAFAGRGVGCALVLSAVCVSVGFLAFLPTDYLGLAELGLISGMGMFVALVASLTLLPALLAVFHPRRGPGVVTQPIETQRSIVRQYRRPVLVAAGLAGVAAAILVPWLEFDLNPINLRDPDAESIRVFTELAEDVETTPYVINVLADDLDEAQEIAARFRADEAVGSARTLASFVPENQDEKLDILGDAAFFLAPMLLRGEEPEPLSAEQRAAAYEDIRDALPALQAVGDEATAKAAARLKTALDELAPQPDLASLERRWTVHLPSLLSFLGEALTVDEVSREDLPEALADRWIGVGGQARVEVRPASVLWTNQEIVRFAETAQAIDPRVTGSPIVVREASSAVVGAFQQATLIATFGILALLIVTLRRISDVALAMVPLLLAALLTLATAVVLGISLNFANVIVLPLLMGLGVSSGIHLVLRARQSPVGGELLRTSTPRAVLLSVATTLASFGTMIVSPHQGMSSMGALLTIAGVFTLFSVLVILPCMLAELNARRNVEST